MGCDSGGLVALAHKKPQMLLASGAERTVPHSLDSRDAEETAPLQHHCLSTMSTWPRGGAPNGAQLELANQGTQSPSTKYREDRKGCCFASWVSKSLVRGSNESILLSVSANRFQLGQRSPVFGLKGLSSLMPPLTCGAPSVCRIHSQTRTGRTMIPYTCTPFS